MLTLRKAKGVINEISTFDHCCCCARLCFFTGGKGAATYKRSDEIRGRHLAAEEGVLWKADEDQLRFPWKNVRGLLS
jgi:hypothetical protein